MERNEKMSFHDIMTLSLFPRVYSIHFNRYEKSDFKLICLILLPSKDGIVLLFNQVYLEVHKICLVTQILG